MNTYLPYADFAKSAEVLDDKRLSRQRADVISILKACLEDPPQDGNEHSVIRMWRGSEQWLIRYGLNVCFEFQSRGNTDTLLKKIREFEVKFTNGNEKPEWLGDDHFHNSHQSYLLRCIPSHYGNFFNVRDDLPMIWPRSEIRAEQSRTERQRQKAIRKAQKAKERAVTAIRDARVAALEAGLHPDTLEPLTEVEREEFDLEDQSNQVDADQLPLLPESLS